MSEAEKPYLCQGKGPAFRQKPVADSPSGGYRQQSLTSGDHSAIFADGKRITEMNELIFIVEDAPEGGYTAQALGTSIITHGETIEVLHERVRDAVRRLFDNGEAPRVVRMNFVRGRSYRATRSARERYEPGLAAESPT
jgi:hypothetical protein